MTRRQIECFLMVADCLNISQAAKRMFISQPALSKQIKSMEEELGVSLFFRNNQKLELSEAGQVMLTESHKFLDTYYHMIEKVKLCKNESSTVLTVLYSAASVSTKIPDLFATYKQDVPVSTVFWQKQNTAILEDLKSGHADIGFMLTKDHYEDPELETVVIEKSDLCVALLKQHPLAASKTLSLSDLYAETLVGVVSEELPYDSINYNQILHNLTNGRMNIVYANNMTMAIALVRSGAGFTLIAPGFYQLDDSLCTIPLSETITTQLVAVWNKRNPNPSLPELAAYIQSNF